VPRSHCATRRTGALYPAALPQWTGVYRKGRKSQFGSRGLLGAYVVFAFGSHERCEAVFRCANPVSRQQPHRELHWAKPRTC
jgi:hypothetical protein